ncbi:dihydrodipicolinate synthase family protein [Mesorhizobium argentiipisi]|uniref:Dihydrodipicolinate synthase family protein n=1 Tax=Mesorhizobium argentiipisi TaxID=3015175 RepID=A0ABU8KAB3_9HYPH
MINWKGVFPAVTTKLNPDGSINVAAHQASLDRLIVNGVTGVIVLPMLGENASMAPKEKEHVIRISKEAVAGRVPLLSGLAEITQDAACERAREFEAYGVEGLMAFPSLAYKTDPRETAQWYQKLAGASGLPIMIYNNPIAYGVDVTPAILKELVDYPTIESVKDETGDVRRVTDTYVELGNRFHVCCGVDDQIVESVALGSVGWVSGMTNAWPAECVALFRLCAAGRKDEALQLYRIMTPAFHLDTHVKLVQCIKLAENLVCGSPEWTRAPRLPLVGEERERVIRIVQDTIAKLEAYKLPKVA